MTVGPIPFQVGLLSTGGYDTDIYSGSDKFAGYFTSIAPNEEEDVGCSLIPRFHSKTCTTFSCINMHGIGMSESHVFVEVRV